MPIWGLLDGRLEPDWNERKVIAQMITKTTIMGHGELCKMRRGTNITLRHSDRVGTGRGNYWLSAKYLQRLVLQAGFTIQLCLANGWLYE